MIPERCLRCLIWDAAQAICSWEAEGGGNSSPRASSVCSQLWAFCSHQLIARVSSGCVHISTSCAQSGVPNDSSSLLPLCCQMFRSTPDRFIKQGIFFHITFIPMFSKIYFFRNFSIGRGNLASLKVSLASSVIVQRQKYPKVHTNFQNAFPLDIPSLLWDQWEPMTPPLSRQMRVRQNSR